ncbi:MAG TPA: response regulator [Vitreimonas sp.]|nr:response regulator [Vitreimonas sp.]
MSEAAKLKVLIIEDESIVAMMIEDLIVDMGHEVVGTAGRLEQAQKLVEDLAIDFAIVDVNLNGVHTYPVAETLKARGVPFVFATGYGVQGLKDEWKQTPVLQKPFQPDELTRAIDTVAKG